MPTLDPSQLAFCESPATNVRLLAPAGCGKTLALLHRCVYLAKHAHTGRPRFLLVTFTRAAKEEIEARLSTDQVFADICDLVEVFTLNAWGNRRIKNTATSYKLLTDDRERGFAVWNQLQPIWREHSPVESAITAKKGKSRRNRTAALMGLIDAFKSLGFTHERHTSLAEFSSHWQQLVDQGLEWWLANIMEELIDLGIIDPNKHEQPIQSSPRLIWRRFFRFWLEATRHLIASETFTFEDQKYFAYLDEQSNLENGRYLSGAAGYSHVLVDEFQDINPLDVALVRAITERSRATLTIVGDDDQAIFEWRGATPEYILNPEKHLGRAFETHTLEVNYRSPSNIVKHSQRLIANNDRRVHKKIRSHDTSRANQALIEIRRSPTLADSMNYVIELVRYTIDAKRSPGEIAVIGKLRGQIIPYQIHFVSERIPFGAAEDLQVILSRAFKKVLNLMSIKETSWQRQSARKVVDALLDLCDLTGPFEIRGRNRDALRSHLMNDRPRSVNSAISILSETETKVGTLAAKYLRQSADSIEEFVNADSVTESLNVLSDRFRGLQRDFGKAEADVFYTNPPFLHLAEYALRYGDDYDSFIEDLEHAQEALAHVPPFDDESSEPLPNHPLKLMTAHRAKGKEFDTVVLLDVNDGIWPKKNAETEPEIEAERRVFYVAFTRARKRVVMLTDANQPISPYVKELGLAA